MFGNVVNVLVFGSPGKGLGLKGGSCWTSVGLVWCHEDISNNSNSSWNGIGNSGSDKILFKQALTIILMLGFQTAQ